MKRLFAFTVVLLLSASVQVLAQDEPGGDDPIQIGAVVGVNYSMQQGTIDAGDDCYVCSSYTDGSGIGAMAGLRVFVPLSQELFLRGGIEFDMVNLEFDPVQDTYPYLGSDNKTGELELLHEMDLSYTSMTVEAMVGYRFAKEGLYLLAGPAYNLLMSSSIKLTEEIVSPEEVTYLDGSRSRVLIDGEIPDVSSYMSIRAGVGITFPLGTGISLSPEIMYSFPLSDIASDPDWSVSGLNLALAVMFAL